MESSLMDEKQLAEVIIEAIHRDDPIVEKLAFNSLLREKTLALMSADVYGRCTKGHGRDKTPQDVYIRYTQTALGLLLQKYPFLKMRLGEDALSLFPGTMGEL